MFKEIEINCDQVTMNRSAAIAACSAGMLCLLVYLQTLGNDFIYTDDPVYVYNNSQIIGLNWRMVSSAFTRLFAGDYWMPLTWLSYAVDYRFWGLDPAGYHLTNSVLHAINTGLVVLVSDLVARQSGWVDRGRSYTYLFILVTTGLLWGVHPLRVESVAWVMCRKDVLNGIFTLASLWMYLGYVQRRCRPGGTGSVLYYLASLALFICSLMSKPVSVVLPVVLLVADWYPLDRLKRDTVVRLLLEKLPFLACSVAITVITILAKMQYGGLQSTENLPFAVRLVLSGNAVFEYVRLSLWPVGIIFFYPLPKPIPLLFIIKTAGVLSITLVAIRLASQRPWFCASWCCFLVLLLPVLAFMHNGIDIALAPRFTYLAAIIPSIALTVVLAASVQKYGNQISPVWPRMLAMFLVVLVMWYAGVSIKLIRSWQDTGTLWTRQIDHLPLGRAYNARGHYYLIRARYPEAVQDFSTALAIAERAGPAFVDNLLAFRGEARYRAGQFELALVDYSAAIELNPRPRYYYHRGLALEALGRTEDAGKDFLQAGGDSGPIIWFAEEVL